MPTRRLAVADPLSLVGKELLARLPGSDDPPAEVVLLDREERRGTLVEYDGEPTVLGILDADAVAEIDVLAVCGLAEVAQGLLGQLLENGTMVVDLTGHLTHPDAQIILPTLADGQLEDGWLFRVPQPASTAVARILGPLCASTDILRADCVLLQGVADLGNPGIDELHAQTVAALSFKAAETGLLGARLAFNAVPLAKGARRALELRVRNEVSHLLRGAPPLTVSVVRVPVFFGAGLLLLLELDDSLPAQLAADLLSEVAGVVAVVDQPIGVGELPDDPTGGPMHVSAYDGDADGRLRLWVAYDDLRYGQIGAALEIIGALPSS